MVRKHSVAIICLDQKDGKDWLADHGLLAGQPLFVSPRSPAGARGRNLSAVFVTDAMTSHRRLHELMEATAPAVLTS